MRHVTSTLAAFALAGAVSVFAQDQAPSQQQQQPPAGDQSAKSTLTGCVVQAKTTAGDTVYVLGKAEGGTAQMYVLGGSAQSDWSANVNKKVEVTGPVQEPPSADPNSSQDPKVVRPPMVVVESVKVVADSCT
jgi:hypothetical protein